MIPLVFCFAVLLQAEDIDSVIQEIDFALFGEGESEWETEKRSETIIPFLERHLSDDTAKTGMTLLGAYSLGYRYFNFRSGYFRSKGIDSSAYYDSLANVCRNSQTELFEMMVLLNKAPLDELYEKYQRYGIAVTEKTKAVLARYKLGKKNGTLGDTAEYLMVVCEDKDTVERICSGFMQNIRDKKAKGKFAGIAGICIDCLDGYVPDETMVNYLKLYRAVYVQRGIVHDDNGYADEEEEKQMFDDKLAEIDSRISQKERLVLLKKKELPKRRAPE